MKIIVINGVPTSGKDQFVTFAKKGEAEIYNLSCIDYVKEAAKKIGWHGDKDEKSRRFLSDLKDAFDLYNDEPFQSVKRQIKLASEGAWDVDNLIFFIHAREPKDIQRWVEETNAKTLLIRRASVEDTQVYSNHADKAVYDYDYDYVYSNDGDLEKLEHDAISFVNWIIKKPWESHI